MSFQIFQYTYNNMVIVLLDRCSSGHSVITDIMMFNACWVGITCTVKCV